MSYDRDFDRLQNELAAMDRLSDVLRSLDAAVGSSADTDNEPNSSFVLPYASFKTIKNAKKLEPAE